MKTSHIVQMELWGGQKSWPTAVIGTKPSSPAYSNNHKKKSCADLLQNAQHSQSRYKNQDQYETTVLRSRAAGTARCLRSLMAQLLRCSDVGKGGGPIIKVSALGSWFFNVAFSTQANLWARIDFESDSGRDPTPITAKKSWRISMI